MNGFMSTLLDPQEYCLQGMSYTFSQLLVHTVHLTAQTASCAMNYVSSYCCSSATVPLYNMTKVHQADRTVVRMNDNRIYKNVNLFPQDWHCSRATAKKNISLNNLWNGEVWVLRTHAKSERCFFFQLDFSFSHSDVTLTPHDGRWFQILYQLSATKNTEKS